jgi:hypothetical protein
MEQKRRPDHAQIAARAYELFVERGRVPGHAMRDWLDAEAELAGEIPPPEEPAQAHRPPSRDPVTEASWESFPASDPPTWRSGTT